MIIEIEDPSGVAAARRQALSLAQSIGLNEDLQGRVALVTTELASNLAKHARQGRLILSSYEDSSNLGLEILSLDRGPGIPNVDDAMRDGMSTAGSLGGGLGALLRQSTQFDLFTMAGAGTVIMCRVGRSSPERAASKVTLGSVVVPKAGETVSGDGWAYAVPALGPTLMLVDGSGHGINAHLAASTAVQSFHANCESNCPALMGSMHRALASTRGGAVGLARVDLVRGHTLYVGIGNITAAVICGGSVRRMISNNGIAGHVASTIREFSYPYEAPLTIVLHSDGISARWDLADYPGLAYAHPSILAAVLYRDHARHSDDAAVVALRLQ
jgi:anti-sigma regulatory factor (Ser/Thr protein kinase)